MSRMTWKSREDSLIQTRFFFRTTSFLMRARSKRSCLAVRKVVIQGSPLATRCRPCRLGRFIHRTMERTCRVLISRTIHLNSS
jgi:hypothetical protein